MGLKLLFLTPIFTRDGSWFELCVTFVLVSLYPVRFVLSFKLVIFRGEFIFIGLNCFFSNLQIPNKFLGLSVKEIGWLLPHFWWEFKLFDSVLLESLEFRIPDLKYGKLVNDRKTEFLRVRAWHCPHMGLQTQWCYSAFSSWKSCSWQI